MYRVYLPRKIAPEAMTYLSDKGYEIKLGTGQDEATMIREIADCDALLVRMDRVTAAVIDAAPGLKVIARHGVGLDNIDVGHATKKGIWVTVAGMSNYNAVAEHTVMLMLACAKRVQFMREHTSSGDYEEAQRNRGEELAGKTPRHSGAGKGRNPRCGNRAFRVWHANPRLRSHDPAGFGLDSPCGRSGRRAAAGGFSHAASSSDAGDRAIYRRA